MKFELKKNFNFIYYLADMEKHKCVICKKEKTKKAFRPVPMQSKKRNLICRKCEMGRDNTLWL